jgi:hypothetical protein
MLELSLQLEIVVEVLKNVSEVDESRNRLLERADLPAYVCGETDMPGVP